MKGIRRIKLLCKTVFGLCIVIFFTAACAAEDLSEKEAFIVVDRLLGSKAGADNKAELARDREWGNLYIKYWKLMSDESSYTTGSFIDVSGGR